MSIFELQRESDGIVYEGYEREYKICRYEQEPVAGKNEIYIFRCRPDKECCGRECCIPAEAGFPLWLLILILILVFLLLLFLLAALMYYCWKLFKRRQKPVPSPMPVKKDYRPVHVDTRHDHDFESSGPVSAVQIQTDEEKFEPDAMEESMLPFIEPSTYEWGEDISMEKSVVISNPERPPEQRAQIMYRTPGYDTVASY